MLEWWILRSEKQNPSKQIGALLFSPGCSGREEVCGTGTVTHVRLGSFVHPACCELSSAIWTGLLREGMRLVFGHKLRNEPSDWNRSMEVHFSVGSFWKLQLCDMPPSQLCAVLVMFPTWNLQWGNKETHLSLWAQRCSQLPVKENLELSGKLWAWENILQAMAFCVLSIKDSPESMERYGFIRDLLERW